MLRGEIRSAEHDTCRRDNRHVNGDNHTRAQAKTTITYYSLSLQLLSVVLESTSSESLLYSGTVILPVLYEVSVYSA